jgi:hypothetical protein
MQCVGIAQLDRASILLPEGANHAVPDFRSLSCSQLRELLSNGAATSSMSAFRYFPLSKKTKISFSPVSPYSSEVERVRVGGLDASAVEMPFTNSSLSVLLMNCIAGCSHPNAPVDLSLLPRRTIVFSTQTDLFAATDSLGNSDLVWSVAGPNANSPSPTIDSSGTFIAPEVTQNTTFTVTVTSRTLP